MFYMHDITPDDLWFDCEARNYLLQFYGERGDDAAFYAFVAEIEKEMDEKGFIPLKRDDLTDTSDYLCHIHFISF